MRRLRRHPRHRVAMRKVWGSSLLSLSACSKKPRTASLIWKWSVKRRRRVLWVVLGGSIKWCFPLTTLIQQMRTKGCRSLRVQSGILIFFNRWTSKPPLPGLLLYTSTDTQKGFFFFFIKEIFFRVFVDRKLANHCISYALSIYRVFNAKSGLIELH